MSIDYQELITPCYVIKENVLKTVANTFQSEVGKFFSNAIVSYSVKANYHPYIIRCLYECGYWLEVASEDEYNMVRKTVKETNIIYNGPLKTKKSFLDAILSGCIVNLDSFAEISWLSELPKERYYNVGIRVNYDLSQYSKEYKKGERKSRFGFSLESGVLENALERIRKYPNISVTVLHMHRGGTLKSCETYRAMIEVACKIIKIFGLKIQYIDIGGGFRLNIPSGLSLLDYLSVMKAEIKKNGLLNKVSYIFEPGNSIVFPCVDYISRVFDKKRIKDTIYVTLDGCRLHTDPLLNRKYYMNIRIVRNNEPSMAGKYEQILCGYSCMEGDCLAIIDDFEVEIGDMVIFEQVGAYTMSRVANFIVGYPSVYVYDQRGFSSKE